MTGGKFQGANAADFSGAVDLFTLTNAPLEGTLTEQAITVTNGYRYVRYLAPAGGYGNVAEVEFYGADATAVSSTWIADSNGTWSDTNKWSGGNVASGAGFTADFSTLNITAGHTVTLDASHSIGTLKFGDTAGAQSWNLSASGGSILTLDTGSSSSPSILVNQGAAMISAPVAGANGFTKRGAGTLILAGNNPLFGALNVDTSSNTTNDGIVRLTSSAAIAHIDSPIAIRNNNNGTSTFQLDGSGGNINVSQDFTVNCRAGSVATIQNLAGTNTLSGDIWLNVGGSFFNIQSDAGLLVFSGTNQYVGSLAGGRSYTFLGAGHHLVSGPILNSTNGALISLTKSGSGTLTLVATNTYGGTTTVNAGTLLVNGGIGTNTVAVVGGMLGGSGLINGPVTVQLGGTLSPGVSLGTLTISNRLVLSGTTFMELDQSLGTNDQVRGLSSVRYGGVLVLMNRSGTLTASNAFRLFTAASYSGAFASLSPATPAPGLAWNTNTLAIDGTLRLVQTVDTTPTNIISQVSDGTLALSWPASHIGWGLQAQTNGLGTNWSAVPDAEFTNRIFAPIDPANGSVFYRLAFPPR